jgi:thiol-disulfide isomerase/thioredoxin
MRTTKTLATLAFALLAILPAVAAPTWLTNFEEAKKIAIKEGKPLLLDFTGSDWCPPCKALHKNVFSTEEFSKEAADKYVLVELDFPRTKQLAQELKAQNSELQKKYAVTGYPTVLLVDAKTGDVFGRSVGFGGWTPRQFLDKLAAYKNTPEGKAALVEEEKKTGEARAKANAARTAANAKIMAAVGAKDFEAACKAIDEAAGTNKLMAAVGKAQASQQIDPANKERALKFIDEAISIDAGANANALKAIRERIISGTSQRAAPAAKPAAEGKKSDQGA